MNKYNRGNFPNLHFLVVSVLLCGVLVFACTSNGIQVFFGGNDDDIDLDSSYWIDPAEITLEAVAGLVCNARY